MTRTRPRACLNVDLDSLSCYRDIHGLPARDSEAADPAYTVGVRRLLDLFESHDVPATLFVIGRDVDRRGHTDILREALDAGHELASHSQTHDYALRDREIWEIRADLEQADAALTEVIGERPRGFRAPGYNVDARILSVCRELGYRYDSSVFPCPPYYLAKTAVMGWLALRGTPSRSAMTHPGALAAPLRPYRPDATWFWRTDPEGSLPLEIPMCVVPGIRFPIIGTSLHVLGKRGFDLVYPVLRRTHRLFNLEFHAIDFMDADDPGTADLIAHQPDLKIPWERKRSLYEHVIERLREHYDFETLARAAS